MGALQLVLGASCRPRTPILYRAAYLSDRRPGGLEERGRRHHFVRNAEQAAKRSRAGVGVGVTRSGATRPLAGGGSFASTLGTGALALLRG